ncbi:hypothetical protein ABFS82_11G012100 [Erythranthe guttata]
MSYPDPTPPTYPFIPPPFAAGDGGAPAAGFWPGFWTGNNDQQHQQQQQQQPDLMSQFDRPPYKRPRIAEKPSNFPPPVQQTNPRMNPPNIPVNKGTSHIFFKTRICSKFNEGKCENGDQCSFAHGPEDLRQPPPNWQELIREKDRASMNNASSFGGNGGDDRRTMIHRMKICKKFYNGEECPYGDKCNFLHERPLSPPVRKFRPDDMPEQRESSVINVGITWDASRGNVGADVDHNKVFWKTRMCSKWEMGQCPFGDRCHYAHGQSELKSHVSVSDSVHFEPAKEAASIPRKPVPVSTFIAAPANNLVAAIPSSNGDEESKKLSKWKLTKKINRIYADWLDDMTPPHNSPTQEDI